MKWVKKVFAEWLYVTDVPFGEWFMTQKACKLSRIDKIIANCEYLTKAIFKSSTVRQKGESKTGVLRKQGTQTFPKNEHFQWRIQTVWEIGGLGAQTLASKNHFSSFLFSVVFQQKISLSSDQWCHLILFI